jgi:hypothetical protein
MNQIRKSRPLPPQPIELPGLDAANLLGYMAALGVLRSLSGVDSDVRLSWSDAPGWWSPAIHHPSASAETLVEILGVTLSGDPNPAWSLGEDLTIRRPDFAEYARSAIGQASVGPSNPRYTCDFLAAFGSDGCAASGKDDLIADTAFRTMSGAGHQHFLGFMKELHRSTTTGHLAATLFKPWEYSDDKPSMRWDPNDYRPHALRAEDPSSDPIRTVRGANRLAVEALALFPTMPRLGGLRTTGFDRKSEVFTYPVWVAPLGCPTVTSLLALDLPDDLSNCRRELDARGIAQLFRTTRFTEGKYRNFSPSRELL